MGRRNAHHMRGWAVVALVVLMGACSAREVAGSAPGPSIGSAPAEPEPAPTDPTPDEGGDDAVTGTPSWNDPFQLTLPTGWTVRDCEGDRPHMCVWDGDVFLGDIEIVGGYPLDPVDDPRDPEGLLTAWAERFVADFREDRAKGCPDFTFTGDDVTPARIGGEPAVRTGFTLRATDGTVVERVVNHYTLHGGEIWLVNTDAYAAEGGCLAPSETDPSFLPTDMATMERFLDDLVDRTPMPSPTLTQ